MSFPNASRFLVPLAIVAVFLPQTGFAAAKSLQPTKPINPEAVKYTNCVAKASVDPGGALDMATAWRANGGGVAAQHCVALALVELEKYDEAARRLEAVAQDLQSGQGTFGLNGDSNAVLLPQVYGQAGNAWLMAGNYSRAYSILSTALASVKLHTAQEADLLLDRSRALVGLKNYEKALVDLDRAQEISPKRADILIYRAADYRILQRLDDANADLQAALKLDPDNPEVLVERGNVRLQAGDIAAARADWQQVTIKYPGTPEAAAAAKNLAANRLQAAIPPAPKPPVRSQNSAPSGH